MHRFQKHKKLIATLLLALGLRLILFGAVGSWRPEIVEARILVHGALEYHTIAVNLVDNAAFSSSPSPPYAPNIHRPPAYPTFLAILYAITGYKPYIVILCQLMISSATCYLAYRLGKLFLAEQSALLAGFLLAVDYLGIFNSNVLIADTLFTFLFIVHTFFLARFLKAHKNKDLVFSAVFLGLATLCKPVSIYFPLFIVWFFVVISWSSLRQGALRFFMWLLLFLAITTPWMVRNYTVSGKFLLSSQQEAVLRWNLGRSVNAILANHNATPDQQKDPFQDPNQMTSPQNRVMNALLFDAKKYLDGSARFFLMMGRSYPQFLGYPGYRFQKKDWWQKGVFELGIILLQNASTLDLFIIGFAAVSFLFLYPSACFGIMMAIKRKRFQEILLFVATIAYYVLASAPFVSDARYRVPVMPYIILLSCYGLEQFRRLLGPGQEV